MPVKQRRTGDSSLAARELGFLVRLAQAAASTQAPDELLALIIGEATTAMGVDGCSLYLLVAPGRELLLTATNGLNEGMVRKVKMKVGRASPGPFSSMRSRAIRPRWRRWRRCLRRGGCGARRPGSLGSTSTL